MLPLKGMAAGLVAIVGMVSGLRAEQPLAADARAALARATAFFRSIATEGGYVWRYSADLRERAGEEAVTPTQIWVQPPGTPAVGMAFLRAYEATGEAQYLDAAEAAADALATGQLESGGWDYRIDFDPAHARAWYRRTDVGNVPPADAAKRKNTSTYDDDNTQSALRLLVAVSVATKDPATERARRIRTARDYGLEKLIAAQRPNGGWPQRWDGVTPKPADYPALRASIPAEWPRQHQKESYYGHYTLNDQTHRDCVLTLLDAGKKLDRPEYRAAALKGGEFILAAQLPEPQPAWAQQYNAKMQPAWARAFEPPAVCSSESAGAIQLLVDLHLETGDEKFLAPIPRAIAWLKRSEIAPDTWARLYELGTNRPIFGDRDGKIYYRVEDISAERRDGYGWTGAYGVTRAIAYYEQTVAAGRAAMLAKRDAPRTEKQKSARARALEAKVKKTIAALDADGRWLRESHGAPQILADTFVENVTVLCDYLEQVRVEGRG